MSELQEKIARLIDDGQSSWDAMGLITNGIGLSAPFALEDIRKASEEGRRIMDWGSHSDHFKAVEGMTFDFVYDREAYRHLQDVGTNPYYLSKSAWDLLNAQYRKKPSLRSIDDAWGA